MNFKNLFKKTLLSGLLMTAFGASAVELKDVEPTKEDMLKKEILELFTDGNPVQSNILKIQQLDDTDNYMFKYEENGNYYTMMYIEDIKSVMIQATGELYSLEEKNFLTKRFNSSFTKRFIEEINLEDAITFEANNKENENEIFVFTDPTCGYCQKLHRELKEYQNQDITIHYLPFPRGGLVGQGHNMLVNSYCSTDKAYALNTAKVKGQIPALPENLSPIALQSCNETVKKYYELGGKMGVTGTPAIFSKEGTQLGGYVPAVQLKVMLESLE